MPRKSGAKAATKTSRRSHSLFTSPADAAAMRDARGTTLTQNAKTGMWEVRSAGKLVGKAKSQSAGRRLRYKVENDQGLKVNATAIKRARAAKAKKSTKSTNKAKATTSTKRAGTSRKRSGIKKAANKA